MVCQAWFARVSRCSETWFGDGHFADGPMRSKAEDPFWAERCVKFWGASFLHFLVRAFVCSSKTKGRPTKKILDATEQFFCVEIFLKNYSFLCLRIWCRVLVSLSRVDKETGGLVVSFRRLPAAFLVRPEGDEATWSKSSDGGSPKTILAVAKAWYSE